MIHTNVLFLCLHNSARSQMAEALLRHRAGQRYTVYSAGLEPYALHPYTRKVMDELQIPLAGQRPKHVREYLGRWRFEYVITVCSRAETRCPAALSAVSQRLYWPVADPSLTGPGETMLEKFRVIRDQLDQQIQTWLVAQGWPVQETRLLEKGTPP